MSRKIRVAAAQMGAIHRADTRESVVKRLIELLREAHSCGVQFVVFPELTLTTFFPRWWYEDQAEIDAWFESEMPGPATQPLFDEARRLGIGFHLGYAELTTENGEIRHYNTAIIVEANGNILGKYRKVHLPGHDENRPDKPFQHLEKRYFDIGNLGWPVWRGFNGIVGMCICNDRRWPETWRVMGLKGAELVVLGYNTPDSNVYSYEPVHLRQFHNHLVLQASAYQNGTWVVASAKAGREDGFGLIGGSCVIAPTGEMVARANSEEDELVTATVDYGLCEYIKEHQFNFAKHRQIDQYGLITSQTGVVVDTEN